MVPSARRALTVSRRVLTCAAVGFAFGAILGVLYVLIGWFPGAMATYADNPHFVDPRLTLASWTLAWSTMCGALGFVIGVIVGVLRAATPRSH